MLDKILRQIVAGRLAFLGKPIDTPAGTSARSDPAQAACETQPPPGIGIAGGTGTWKFLTRPDDTRGSRDGTVLAPVGLVELPLYLGVVALPDAP